MDASATISALSPSGIAKARVAFDIVWSAHEAAHTNHDARRIRVRAALKHAIAEHVVMGDDLPTLVQAGHLAVVHADLNG